MSKKIKIGVLLMLLCSCMSVLVSLDARAASYEFYKDYAEPAVSESQGYITFLLYDSSNGYYTNTYFWTTFGTSGGVESPIYADITITGTTFKFTIGGNSAANVEPYYSLYQITDAGNFYHAKSSATSAYSKTFSGNVLGWQVKGNVGALSTSISNTEFAVFYSTDGSAVLLRDIFSVLNESASLNADMYNAVYSIYNSVDSVEGKLDSVVSYLKSIDSDLSDISSELDDIYDKADAILSEQKETNTWLEKIFDYLNESAEQQKQEAQTQGGNSVSQGNSAIEDKGGDFASSLGGLTNSMSYTGTQCAWEFPEVKLPAISGVMDEVVLIRSQPIDFSVWVNAIPSGILLVVQSVCTIGLIVYCFKELYSTIAYVLTLRKDDNS